MEPLLPLMVLRLLCTRRSCRWYLQLQHHSWTKARKKCQKTTGVRRSWAVMVHRARRKLTTSGCLVAAVVVAVVSARHLLHHKDVATPSSGALLSPRMFPTVITAASNARLQCQCAGVQRWA